MKKTTPEQEKTEAELISDLRGKRSYRDFENYLNENIPDGMPGRTTFQSAWNWQNNVNPVNGECVMAWLAFYPNEDPRHQLAIDIIALRMHDKPEYSTTDKKKVYQAVISHTKVGEEKEKVMA